MGRYSHFVFDIDGTLIDTERTGVQSLVDTIRQLMGEDMPYDEAYRYFGIPSGKVGAMLHYSRPEEFSEAWEQNFIRLSYMIKPFDGVGEMLSALKSEGVGIGCVTSRNRFEFGKDVHLAKLLHFFDHTVCAEDTEKHKPCPEPLLKYISLSSERLGKSVLPSECIYIGDTMHDFQCARDAGCDFALADWQGRGLQGIPAQYHLRAVREITDLLI